MRSAESSRTGRLHAADRTRERASRPPLERAGSRAVRRGPLRSSHARRSAVSLRPSCRRRSKAGVVHTVAVRTIRAGPRRAFAEQRCQAGLSCPRCGCHHGCFGPPSDSCHRATASRGTNGTPRHRALVRDTWCRPAPVIRGSRIETRTPRGIARPGGGHGVDCPPARTRHRENRAGARIRDGDSCVGSCDSLLDEATIPQLARVHDAHQTVGRPALSIDRTNARRLFARSAPSSAKAAIVCVPKADTLGQGVEHVPSPSRLTSGRNSEVATVPPWFSCRWRHAGLCEDEARTGGRIRRRQLRRGGRALLLDVAATGGRLASVLCAVRRTGLQG